MKQALESNSLCNLILEAFRLNSALLAVGNHITKPFGLTSVQWQVITTIGLSKKPLTVTQSARRMGRDRQGVQRIVNELERLQLVVFEPNFDHKRSPLVVITKKGTTVLSEIDKAQALWVNQAFKEQNEIGIAQASTLLEVFRERIENRN